MALRNASGAARSSRAVTPLERLPGGGFRVVLSDGSGWDARRVPVTTGLADELPDFPGLREPPRSAPDGCQRRVPGAI